MFYTPEHHLYVGNWTSTGLQWKDIIQDTVSDTIKVSYGITDNKFTSRVASTGTMSFTLTLKTYSLDCYEKGNPVKLVFVYDDEEFCKFMGYISKVIPESGKYQSRRVQISCVDWLNYAGTYPIDLPTIQYNKQIGEAVNEILNSMPQPPMHTVYYPSDNVFPTVFDTASKKNTKAMSEFSTLAASELGYIYLKRDKADGETLVVESQGARNTFGVSTFPKFKSSSNILVDEDNEEFLLETGDDLVLNELIIVDFDSTTENLLTEDSENVLFESGDEVYLNERTTIDFNDNMTNLEATIDNQIINDLTLKLYPRKIDNTISVLFNLDQPIELTSGQQATFKASYVDPSGGNNNIAGKDMVTPVINTDYQMWTAEDATGTDLSSSLDVYVIFGTDSATITLINSSTQIGYVTLLQLRGKAVTLYNAIEYNQQDTDSIFFYGYNSVSLDLKYRDSSKAIDETLNNVLLYYAYPNHLTEANEVSFIANTDELLLCAFLNGDIGLKLHISETQSQVNAYYFINSVEFEVSKSGIINFTWGLRDDLVL